MIEGLSVEGEEGTVNVESFHWVSEVCLKAGWSLPGKVLRLRAVLSNRGIVH